jgi:hypothetical protein
MPGHAAINVRIFLAKNVIGVLNHPPHSPILAAADFLLLPKLKLRLKVHQFDAINDIQRNMTETEYHHCR